MRHRGTELRGPSRLVAPVLFLLLSLVATMMLAPPLARAHLGHVVQNAERYLKLDVGADHARIVVSLMLGPAEARRVLATADRENGDGDGVLTEAEANAYMARWGEGLVEDLPASLDGRALEVSWEAPFIDPLGPIETRPATVEMVARVALAEGRHTLSVTDQMRRETFDRTDVAFRARDGASLVRSGAGEPENRVPDLAFAGEAGPRVFVAVADVPGSNGAPETEAEPARPVDRRELYGGITLLVLLGIAVGFSMARRSLVKRRMKAAAARHPRDD